jgi:hypothetical protein
VKTRADGPDSAIFSEEPLLRRAKARGRCCCAGSGAGIKATYAAGTTQENVPSEYYKTISQGTVANFGTWSVNEADKTITTRSEGALFPNGIGNESKGTVVSVTADEMKTNGVLGNAVWRRFK